MTTIKELNLRQAVEQDHPEGIVEGGRKRKITTLIELGSQDFRAPQMVEALKKWWEPSEQDTLYIINFQDIDVLTPSAAKILVEAAPSFAQEHGTPVIFNNVNARAWESLESAASLWKRYVWAIDPEGKTDLIGPVPERFKEIKNLLAQQGSASASRLAEISSDEVSKKTINKLSVYLQDMFNAGLVGREKVNGLNRIQAERGWTYSYHNAPTTLKHAKNFIRRP